MADSLHDKILDNMEKETTLIEKDLESLKVPDLNKKNSKKGKGFLEKVRGLLRL